MIFAGSRPTARTAPRARPNTWRRIRTARCRCSNAMLGWLADGTRYFGGDAWQRAQTLSWMFFEQYSHEPFIAVARFICGWTPLDSPRRADLANLRARGYQALAVMEVHLSANAWF